MLIFYHDVHILRVIITVSSKDVIPEGVSTKMEDLLLQIVNEASSAKFTELRKAAQEAYGMVNYNLFL